MNIIKYHLTWGSDLRGFGLKGFGLARVYCTTFLFVFKNVFVTCIKAMLFRFSRKPVNEAELRDCNGIFRFPKFFLRGQ